MAGSVPFPPRGFRPCLGQGGDLTSDATVADPAIAETAMAHVRAGGTSTTDHAPQRHEGRSSGGPATLPLATTARCRIAPVARTSLAVSLDATGFNTGPAASGGSRPRTHRRP
jgi:hypothetical protein